MGYTRGTQWTDELIKEKVLEVVSSLNLKRMPSRSECEEYYHDTSLTNAVSRRKGWYQLANELNLPLKESETLFGKTHETLAAETLMALGYEVRKMPQNFPYDLLVDDCVKVDVKASRLYHGTVGNFYSFGLKKEYATCDIYILYIIPDNAEDRVLIIPSKDVIANKQISVGETHSKYYEYEDAWWMIDSATQFWKSITSREKNAG